MDDCDGNSQKCYFNVIENRWKSHVLWASVAELNEATTEQGLAHLGQNATNSAMWRGVIQTLRLRDCSRKHMTMKSPQSVALRPCVFCAAKLQRFCGNMGAIQFAKRPAPATMCVMALFHDSVLA